MPISIIYGYYEDQWNLFLQIVLQMIGWVF